ncbi:MAG: hypothetical protein ACOYOK_03700 [Pseudobdellovibrionaceae bacterium]
MNKTYVVQKIFLCSMFFLFSATTYSVAIEPLGFSAAKNNVQILPQKFTYAVLEQKDLKLGSKIFKSDDFKVSVAKYKTDFVDLNIQWPKDFFPDAELSLKDSSGKAFWSATVSPQMRSPKIHLEDQAYLSFKNSAFFQVCALRRFNSTQFYACSSQMYWSKSTLGKWAIQKRPNKDNSVVVYINGVAVDPQGLVILNDDKQKLFFKAQFINGVSIDFETRLNTVDFKNVIALDDSTFELTATGTLPVVPQQYSQIDEKTWKTRLKKEDPFVYLQGETNIPMLQDFVIQGPLPTIKEQIYFQQKPANKTYSSSVDFTLKPVTLLKLQPAEKTQLQGNQWTFLELEKNSTNVRDLVVNSEDGRRFIASYRIERGLPFETRLLIKQNLAQNSTLLGLNFRWWLDALNLKTGLEIKQDLSLKKSSTYGDFQQQQVLFNYRLESGFYETTWTWGLRAGLQNLKTEVENKSTASLGIWNNRPWTIAGSEDAALETGLDILGLGVQLQAYYIQRWSKRNKFFTGIEHQSLQLKNKDKDTTQNTNLLLGYTYRF